jgi:hypothetical protein
MRAMKYQGYPYHVVAVCLEPGCDWFYDRWVRKGDHNPVGYNAARHMLKKGHDVEMITTRRVSLLNDKTGLH